MRPSQLLAAIVALSSVSAAWPDVFDSVDALGEVRNVFYPRQENSDAPETTQAPESSARESKASASDAKETDAKETGEPSATKSGKDSETTAKPSGSGKASGSGGSKKATKTEFDARLPAGGIQMVTPAAIAGPQYYKIGDWVTFAWNYTSLSVTPSAVDILATCTANQATYTLAVNQSVEETGRVLWDTGAYQSSATTPLLTETYTLLIYDAESSVSATAKPGYLGVYNQFTFGMYTPQPYTPWADFKCANCNGALSAFEQLTLKALLVTCGTTIASLLYFSHSFGLL